MADRRGRNWGKAALLSMASTLAMASGSGAQAQSKTEQAQTRTVDIPAGPLGEALIDVADTYGVDIFAADDLVAGKRAPRVSGALTAKEAVAQVFAGSGLKASPSRPGEYIVTAAAQDASVEVIPPSSDDALDDVSDIQDTVVVTGSRIERTAVNAPSPIDIVTAEDIAKLGLNDTTEALRFVPALNRSVSLTANISPDRDTPGLATLDLRALGTNRTLVLVNGRRHVAGVASAATVDVSSFPTALIDRVEVLTGGGSSIYGADAVSGVVNYILKDDFEGVDARFNASLPTEGDGEAFRGSLTVGGNFGGGRGNAVVNVEYQRQTALQARDRSRSLATATVLSNSPELSAALDVDPSFQNVLVPGALSNVFLPGPAFSLTEDSFQPGPTTGGGPQTVLGIPTLQVIDPSGTIRAPSPSPFFNGFTGLSSDGFEVNFPNPLFETVPSVESYAFNAFADYDFSSRITGFIEAKFSRNESSGRDLNGFLIGGLPINPDNPFIPEEVQNQIDFLEGEGIETNLNVRTTFFADEVTRPNINTRDTFRIVGGFKGEISSALSYEISANYGRTSTSLITPAEPLPDRIYAAADAIADPETGEPICRSDIDAETLPPLAPFRGVAAPGFRSFVPGDGTCAPYNIFAPSDQFDPDFVAFALVPIERRQEIEQFVFNATVTGDSEAFFELPAGGISYAAGFEYRDESSEDRPDALSRAALDRIQSFEIGEIVGGEFDVVEGFAEVSVPVLADLPLAQSFTIDASVRFADYSTVGRTTSFAFGTVWRPVEDFRLRASFNRSVRAPNIGELFTPQINSNSSLAEGTDPCDPNNTDPGTEFREANCRQLIPDLENFDASPAYNLADGLIQVTGGNPLLQEETADTYTIGFAFTPQVVPGLTIVADYYSIQIEDAISRRQSRNALVDNCVDLPSLDNPFCAAVTRNPTTGVIENIQNTTLNIAESSAEGIDYQIGYNFDLSRLFSGDIGDFTAQLAGTYLIGRDNLAFAGFPETNVRLDKAIGYPTHFLNASLAWTKGPWNVDYGFNFQSNQIITSPIRFANFTVDDVLNPEPGTSPVLDRPNTGSAFVHFLGGSYKINDDFQVSLRVNNLLNREPFETVDRTQSFPVGFLGRTIQLGVQANF
ncbi:MAG: TonB-dependent receptor [Pseudomonadota bacterium]